MGWDTHAVSGFGSSWVELICRWRGLHAVSCLNFTKEAHLADKASACHLLGLDHNRPSGCDCKPQIRHHFLFLERPATAASALLKNVARVRQDLQIRAKLLPLLP